MPRTSAFLTRKYDSVYSTDLDRLRLQQSSAKQLDSDILLADLLKYVALLSDRST